MTRRDVTWRAISARPYATGTSPGAVAASVGAVPLTSYIVQAWLWDSAAATAAHALGRGLHSSTFQVNLSRF